MPVDTAKHWSDFIIQLDNLNNLPSKLWVNQSFAVKVRDITPPKPSVHEKVHSLLNKPLTSEY